MKALCLFLLAGILTGCATLSREQCLHGDWYSIGLADGQLGQPMNRIDQHASACAQYGVAPADREYMEGRAQGLRDYCRFDNAFATGLRGQRYQGVCPPEMDAAFNRYNAAAYEIYRIRQELDSVDSQLSSLEYRLGDHKQSDEDRRSIRAEIRELDRRRDRLRDDLYFSERQLDQLEDEARYQSRP